LLNTTGAENTAVGTSALDANTSGNYNIALGGGALGSNTTADNNTALGYTALLSNTTGTQNTAVGAFALDANTTASYNTGVGYQALTANTTGQENAAFGTDALLANTTGGKNTALGAYAMNGNTTASDNTGIGYLALYSNTTGDRNTAVGRNCLDSITTGGNNVGIGWYAGDAATTAAGATFVGYNSGQQSTTAHQQVSIGFETTAYNIDGMIVIGGSTYAASSSTRYITIGYGSDRTYTTPGSSSWSGTSDSRLKENITDHTLGLNFVNALRPVTYNWKKEKDVDNSLAYYKEGSNKRVNQDTETADLKHGFIAQEVKTVMDSNSLDSKSFNLWMEMDDSTQGLSEGELIPILVKALQEADDKIDALTARVTALES